MIRFVDVTAHAAPHSLTQVSLELGPGLHAVLGTPVDGAPLLLTVAAGWVRPRRGRVTVLDLVPAAARRQIAYVPLAARLPPGLRVDEALDAAAEIRGERREPAIDRLATLDVAPLAARRTQSLTAPEARAVLIAEALTSTARVLLVEEPLVDVDPRALGPLAAKLRERATAGATIVIATSSPKDAVDLAPERWILSRGRLTGKTAATDAASLSAGVAPRLRVVSRDARALLAAMTGEPPFARAELDEDTLLLSGDDPAAMAAAVGRAALASGVEIEAMHVDTPRLEELRLAASHRRLPALRPAGLSDSMRPPGLP